MQSPDPKPPAEKPVKEDKDPPVFESVVSVVLFFMLLLLMSNVTVLVVARYNNDNACQAALSWARKAVEEGRSRQAVMHAAIAGVIDKSQADTVLITRPEFVEFKDYRRDGHRALRIRTRCLARIPAPFLMPTAPFNNSGQLALTRTFEMELQPRSAVKAGN